MTEFDGVEVPWGPEPVPGRLEAGRLHGLKGSCLRLHFTDPKSGRDVDIAITARPTTSTEYEHIWHYELRGSELLVSPSIHFHGHFHTAIPARFKLVGTIA